MNSPDPCSILVRSKDGLEIYETPERASDPVPTKKAQLVKGVSTLMKCSPDGRHVFVHLSGHGIVRVPLKETVDTVDKGTPPFLADTGPVQMMDISPMGTYILTWERWYEDKPNNMKLWLADTGELVESFPQKGLKREAWPYLQFSSDEVHGFLMASNEVRVYTAESLKEGRYMDKLRISGVTTMSVPRVSKGSGYTFTSFVLGTKGKPARASLHEYLPGKTASGQYPSLLSKSIFQAEESKTHWSPSGDTALITMQTSVDTSGESYYGSSQLFILAKHLSQAEAIPLEQGGPVYSVSWMPNPERPPCFVVIAGKMPSLATMHNGRDGKPTFQFGNAHRNVVDWAPHGRFLNISGFGNLGGGMGFWDRNKLKLIPGNESNVQGQLRADAVVGHGWSPSSRLFCVSTCSPRMNVDNGLRLFRYNGEELLNLPWSNDNYRPNKLLEACFVPALPTVYPDRPQTPVKEGATSATPAAAVAPTPKPAGRYVPPSARARSAAGGRGGSGSLAEKLRREKEGSMQKSGKVVEKPAVVMSAMTGKTIPGLVQKPETKSKSQIKREKAKLKAAQKEEAERKLREQEAMMASEKAPEEVKVDPEKRARKLKKTLKQIEELKKKPEGDLNDDQKAKIASAAMLEEELALLNI